MRPRKITTLKDLEDFLTQAKTLGLKPEDSIFLFHTDSDAPVNCNPTLFFYNQDGPDSPPFIAIEYWSDIELSNNAEHNDTLNTDPHFTS